MAAAFSVNLSTIVKNPTAATRFYGYLGAHGVKIAAGASYQEHGDLVAKLSHPRKARQRRAFTLDLQNSYLSIIQTPRQIETAGAGGAEQAVSISSTNTVTATNVDHTTATLPT